MGGRLKKVDATGGAPKDLGAAPNFTGGTWSRDGVIVFGSNKGLYRVSAEGGTPELITTLDKGETGHFWPDFLPDGRHYLYLAWSPEAGSRAIFVGTLGSKEKSRLMPAESNVVYADPGYLVFHREATLFAQSFNPNKLTTSGDPVHIADQVAFSSTTGRGNFDVSQNGSLIYFQNAGGRGDSSGRSRTIQNYQLGWRNRAGGIVLTAGDAGTYGDFDLSPDARFIAITRQDGGTADIWIIDSQENRDWRLTRDAADDMNPVWSQPTGDRVAFTTFRKGNADIYVTNANGLGQDAPLIDSPADEFVEDWSKDGRFIAFKLVKDGFEDIYIQALTRDGKPDGKPAAVVEGRYHKDEPQFSYDGKWLAYTSDESGTYEVYVISLPDRLQKFKVSKNGGGQPRWRGNGKELFYRSAGTAEHWVVDFNPATKAAVSNLQQVFTTTASTADAMRHQWSVVSNGDRFLGRVPVNAPLGTTARGAAGAVPFVGYNYQGRAAVNPGSAQGFVSSGLTVIRNWTGAFKNQAHVEAR